MTLQLETPSQDVIQNIICLYDENFSPHVRIPHLKLKKRIHNQTYHILSYKNEHQEWMGFGLVSLNSSLKTIFIDYLCVDKRFQNGGHGRKILHEINQNPNLFQGYEYSVLECEDYLVKYYEKNKYQKIPREYPLENSRPLFMLYRKRFSEHTPKIVDMYHKFILFGLLFNGEIIIVKETIQWLKEFIFFAFCSYFQVIMNFKATHT